MLRVICPILLVIAALFGVWGWIENMTPSSGGGAVASILAFGLFAFERFIKKESTPRPFFGFQYLNRLEDLSASDSDSPLYVSEFDVTNHGSVASDLVVTSESKIRIRIYSSSSVVATGDHATLHFYDHPPEGAAIFTLKCRTETGFISSKWSYDYSTRKIKPV